MTIIIFFKVGFFNGLLSVVWIVLATLMKSQFGWFAVLYGGVISGCVAYYSKGFGFRFQAIATIATLLGILIADTLVVWINWEIFAPNWGNRPPPPFWKLVVYQAKYDGWTIAFMVLGVMGGFVIWRAPD